MSHEAAPFAHEEARRAAEVIGDIPGADSVELVVVGGTTSLTRFANSQISTNVVRREVSAYVRVATGDRVATASANQLDPATVRKTAERALDIARMSLPDEDWPGAADPAKVGRPEGLFVWDDATASASPDERATSVRDILSVAGYDDVAGIYETSAHAYGVFTSTGVDCYDAYTRCVVTCLVNTGDATGWGEASSHARSDVDVEAVADRARSKAERGAGATAAEPGVYEVILEPPAVHSLLEYTSYSGFGAKAMIEGESFFSERSGQKVGSDLVTIADDAAYPLSVAIGFDFDGAPRRRATLIEKGVVKHPVTDLRTSKQLGVENTGHSSGSATYGPYAANVVLEPGDATFEELVAGVERGIAVTRFHYVNILDRPETLLTGMTRDGTFEIVNGEIGRPLTNMRFAQSALDAFGSVVALGAEQFAAAPEYGSFGSTVGPAARIGEFRFTSGTSH